MELDINELLNFSPLMKTFTFNAWVVAGFTPITRGSTLDYYINRPQGMKGYIINLTLRGQARAKAGDGFLLCRENDLLLFPPEAQHFYGRAPDSPDWYHRWVYFRPRAFWAPWLQWRDQVRKVGRMRLQSDALIAEFDTLFQQIEETYKVGKRSSEELAINLLERLLIRCFEETPEHANTPIDARIEEACQFLSRNLAEDVTLEDVARHVCLSPSRLAHLFREQMGVNIVRWREDQRMILAKHLLHASRYPIARVASLVGYEDQMYFSRVFRKRVGTCPSEFRRTSEASPAAPFGRWPACSGSSCWAANWLGARPCWRL